MTGILDQGRIQTLEWPRYDPDDEHASPARLNGWTRQMTDALKAGLSGALELLTTFSGIPTSIGVFTDRRCNSGVP